MDNIRKVTIDVETNPGCDRNEAILSALIMSYKEDCLINLRHNDDVFEIAPDELKTMVISIANSYQPCPKEKQ